MSLVVMKVLRRGCPAASIGIGLALFCAFLEGDLLSSAAGQDGADVRASSEAESPAVPIDNRQFELYGRPDKKYDNDPGVLKYGGYCSSGSRLEKLSYRETGNPAGQPDIAIDIVIHPKDYRYVIHDFFGTFWVILNDPVARGGSRDAAPGAFAFRNVAAPGSDEPQYACVATFRGDDRGRPGTSEGIVGWYEVAGSLITTVMIRFEGLKGIPTTLIDKYLAEHASAVQKDDPRFANWVANDIHKWTTLLQTRASEDHILQGARIQLRHYDRSVLARSSSGIVRAVFVRDC